MELTLKQIIDKADELHRNADENSLINTSLNNYLSELQDMLLCVNAVSLKLSNIYQICSNKKKYGRNKKSANDNIPIIKDNDWTYVYKNIKSANKFTTSQPMLTHDIPINARVVNNISDIPNTPLYWVSSINQFAFHINGIIFRGNIGNIYTKKNNWSAGHQNNQTNQIIICKHGNKCKKILNAEICKFYHDPLDLLELVKCGEVTTDIFDIYKKLNRNFNNTSWLYTDMPHNKNNEQLRKFGSRNTLRHEFELIQLNNSYADNVNIENFRHQCMHDFLVIMGLNQHNLLKEYPDLKMRHHN
jgi:hypothetical protein